MNKKCQTSHLLRICVTHDFANSSVLEIRTDCDILIVVL